MSRDFTDKYWILKDRWALVNGAILIGQENNDIGGKWIVLAVAKNANYEGSSRSIKLGDNVRIETAIVKFMANGLWYALIKPKHIISYKI